MAICGIAAGPNAKPIEQKEIVAMRCSLVSDESGCCASYLPHVAVSCIRKGTNCGIWSSDAVLVACDAELYNKDHLRGDTNGAEKAEDIAALVGRLYLQHGPSFLRLLRGVFCLAIWDERNRTLLLAVDRFGVRTLSYADKRSEIVFASRIRPIFATARLSKEVDLSAITDYLMYTVVPGPRTSFQGVAKLCPGEYLLWNSSGTQIQRYWEMQYSADLSGTTKALAEELRSRMEEAVRVTSADLDLTKAGCFLSGGTDSSSIVGLLTGIRQRSVNAFSIGFAEDRFNELRFARLAARHFCSNHFENVLGPDDAYGIVNKIVHGYDEPFGNSSVIATYCCAKLAHDRGMELLLAGDGGDELFGGNERYRIDKIFDAYQRVPKTLRTCLVEPLIQCLPFKRGVFGKAQRYIQTSNVGNPERYCQWRLLRMFRPDQVLGSEMPYRNGHADLLATVRRHYEAAPSCSELNRLLYIDVKMTLGDDDLPKVVRASELAGIKVRFPYLDDQLAEFAGRLPADLKVRYFEKRYLFKKATQSLLPKEILSKKKHGFGLPIGIWLKTHPKLRGWSREVLCDPRTYQRGYFQRSFIDQLFGSMQQDNTPYFGDLLWVFLMLELWHRIHIESSAC